MVTWAFQPKPGSRHFAVIVSPEEYEFVMSRGYATLDGVRARVVKDCCVKESGFIRLLLDEDYQVPTATLEAA